MIHRLYLIAVILLCPPALYAYDALTPASSGALVECRDCWIYWRPADDKWRMEVEYRIDESEWRHAANQREHAGTELRLPGTSVTLKVEDGRYWHDYGEDVRELRWIESD
jgi:hypothetical protein